MYVVYGVAAFYVVLAWRVAAFYVVLAWRFLVVPYWPWDWKGNRREIKLKRSRRDWEDDGD